MPELPVPVTVQPSEVCRDIAFLVASWMPSMMSISPFAGHVFSGPKDQKLGQLPHVLEGMCITSRMKRPRL
jgi:hypothetical protein